jgi:hypothetical protein
MEMSRSQRLRLFLLGGVALFASLLPVTLAGFNALRAWGAGAYAETPQNLALIVLLGIAAPLASLWLSTLRILGGGAVLATVLTLLGEGHVGGNAMLSVAYPAVGLRSPCLGGRPRTT